MGEESGKEEMRVVEEVRKVKIHSSGTGVWMKPTVGEAISETMEVSRCNQAFPPPSQHARVSHVSGYLWPLISFNG